VSCHQKTIKTYDDSASDLAEYFKGIGPRVSDIEIAIDLVDSDLPIRAVEIGCGDGRDATEIIKRVSWYQGFDPSAEMLKIAKQTVPNGSFIKADALSFDYPHNLDVVFAFASLLHVSKADLTNVFRKVHKTLKPKGIFYISLKESSHYTKAIKRDAFGERLFYFYNSSIIKELAKGFKSIHEDHQKIGKTDWFTIALEKN